MDDNILRKVRALLAQAEDSAATPGEAELFSSKAEALIAKYAIDRAELEAKQETKGAPVMVTWSIPNPYGKAKSSMLGGIAEAFGCRVVIRRDIDGSKNLIVAGFKSDLDAVEMLYTSLLLQGTNGLLQQPLSDKSFRASYWYGFAGRVATRIRALRNRETAERSAGTALVLADRRGEVDEFFRQQFPNIRSGGRGRVTSRLGAEMGRKAADRADLGGSRIGGAAAAALA